MKQVAKNLVVLGALALAGSAVAEFGDFAPYAGVDYHHAWMKEKLDAGSTQAMPKSFPGASFYVGTKFHENFGAELGYTLTPTAKKNYKEAAAGVDETYKFKRPSAHIDLLGFLPVADCFELMGSVGYGLVKPKITVVDNTAPSTSAKIPTKKHGVFRFGFGGIYNITEMFGLRAKLGYETTSSMRYKNTSEKAFKNSLTASAGVFVKF